MSWYLVIGAEKFIQPSSHILAMNRIVTGSRLRRGHRNSSRHLRKRRARENVVETIGDVLTGHANIVLLGARLQNRRQHVHGRRRRTGSLLLLKELVHALGQILTGQARFGHRWSIDLQAEGIISTLHTQFNGWKVCRRRSLGRQGKSRRKDSQSLRIRGTRRVQRI